MTRWIVLALCACAVPKPRTVDDPVARLAPAWRESIGVDTFTMVGSRVFVAGDNTPLQALELHDGYRSGPWRQLHGVLAAATTRKFTVFATTAKPSELISVPHRIGDRLPPGEEPVRLGDDAAELQGRLFGGLDRVYAIRSQPLPVVPDPWLGPDPKPPVIMGRDLVTIAIPSGTLRAVPLPASVTGDLIGVQRGIFVIAGGAPISVTAFDIASGREVWRHPAPTLHASAVDATRVVLAETDALVIVDVMTGRGERIAYPKQLHGAQLRLAGDTAYVVGPGAPETELGHVLAVDLRTRDVRILARAHVHAEAGFAVGDSVVFVQSPNGTLRAIDRRTGAYRWEWSTAGNVELVAKGDRLLVIAKHELTMFAPTRTPPPLETMVIRGRVAIECGESAHQAVRVGERTVYADRDGRFEIMVTARGRIGIGVHEFTESIEVTGRERRIPVLHASNCDGA